MWRILILCLIATPALSHPTPEIKAIFDGDHVIFEDGKASIDTPFAIASVGKLFTTVAFVRLIGRGELYSSDLAADWVPSAISEGLGGLYAVQLHDLATMTAGLPDYYDNDYIDAIKDMPLEHQTTAFALSFAFGEPILFKSGTGFVYSNTNYLVLSLAMQAATGKSYAQIIQDEVIGPAKLENSSVFGSAPLPADFPKGHASSRHIQEYYENQGLADGGILSSAADLARLYTAIRYGDLVPDHLIGLLTADPLGQGYAMGLVVEDGMIGHSGGDVGFSSLVAMDWETGRIAIELYGESDVETGWAWGAARP
ncbi:MAG: serine hydrolase domain-containing protein [Pseudomonadota bacterium]